MDAWTSSAAAVTAASIGLPETPTAISRLRGFCLPQTCPVSPCPASGTFNGDGTVDLAVGSDSGVLLVYYGQNIDGTVSFDHSRMSSLSRLCADAELGQWLAPGQVDWNG